MIGIEGCYSETANEILKNIAENPTLDTRDTRRALALALALRYIEDLGRSAVSLKVQRQMADQSMDIRNAIFVILADDGEIIQSIFPLVEHD
jgi:hypothetical protein